jgi:glutamate synthase (NADPH/NADH) small chain
VRIRDWSEVYEPFTEDETKEQGARCMDCGIAFCHEGCPLGNLIPEWNDLVYRSDWSAAIDRLHATNNFPEFTGRLCPAPCEGACVLGINDDPVAIERIEYEIVERAWSESWVKPVRATLKTGKRVAVVGSGPAGLAAAQQLVRAGHDIVVFERGEKPGGLLRYGIPEFKMEKAVIERRLSQLEDEGVEFRCSTLIGHHDDLSSSAEPWSSRLPGSACAQGVTVIDAATIVAEYDAVVLACGSTIPRDLKVPGRELEGVHQAMEYLKPSNLVREGLLEAPVIDAHGKHVIIIGGGDTGADCLGTALRQGAALVTQLEIMPAPPEQRSASNPWPTWPVVFRTSSAHEEGGDRIFEVSTTELVGDANGRVTALRYQPMAADQDGSGPLMPVGEPHEIQAELILLAMGFTGPEQGTVVAELDLELTERSTVRCDETWQTTKPGVFVCGDMTRGQSLIVWAIAEGRSAAAAVDRYLMGETDLPSPLTPGQMAIR